MERRLRIPWAILFLGALWGTPASAQQETTKLTIRVVLIDRDLNPKPVPKLNLSLKASATESGALPVNVTTGFDGVAQVQLPSGRYQLSTPQPVDFQGKRYSWKLELELSGPEKSLDLSRDNAQVAEGPVETPGAPAEDLGAQFKRLQNSVFTVWSESGHGTGFLVDSRGLVVTNQHVVAESEYLAVQFDARRKVAAQLLASDAQKDIAVLWINPAAFPEALAAPMAGSEKSLPAEGERVFTIGSPLTLQKILTTGIVSKVESRAILSDININPGNSGGPLFNSRGEVIGITTFGARAGSGPGIAGIVRVEQALPLLEQARAKLAGTTPPSTRQLPVEPSLHFPVEALTSIPADVKVDRNAYEFSAGEYDVRLETPLNEFRARRQAETQAERKRQKRTKSKEDSASSEPPRNWAQDAGEYPAVIRIYAWPKLKEGFWSAMARGPYAPANLHFKTDFYRMRLLCAGKEIEPVRPGKVRITMAVRNAAVNVNDAASYGMYVYRPEAIAPACGPMVLELYATKGDQASASKELDPKTIEAIWGDFEPFRKAAGEANPAPRPQ